MPLLSLTRPSETVWQISLNSPPDNRLTPPLLAELAEALDIVELEWRNAGGGVQDPKKRSTYKNKGAGALILTSGCERFFSNGLDYVGSLKVDNFFQDVFDPVLWRLMTFPLVTIGALNGHAFAGGMVIALACDYRIMTSGKGWMCMSEVTFGAPLPNSFGAFLPTLIPNPQHLRDTMLARRWTQPELLEIGLIDEIVKPEEVLKRAIEVGEREGPKVAPGSWGLIKEDLRKPIIVASHEPASPRRLDSGQIFFERIAKDRKKLEAKAKL
ncbi:hypothetical protein L202_00273 [Cryptococcus amylolentus CBS 6039]|uniref:Enoyl-CoA hydratase n=1 Tax=Cryptococcus amylolentus CBS 6039 TaxID=1295533 RepID=A0A1E3I6U6_9TREE|nr:hypothetical protein L202_00273 [Cryptococcus amylolentus CBS 6039]ODN84292.1 hypothetical protein L202_00273 [Cryptococcus amylolentus CBS 6039]